MHEIDSIKEREKRSLYTYLMYFKEVEKRVRKSITNLVENPSSETLKDFQIMGEQLRALVAQLERFCVYFARDDVVDKRLKAPSQAHSYKANAIDVVVFRCIVYSNIRIIYYI